MFLDKTYIVHLTLAAGISTGCAANEATPIAPPPPPPPPPAEHIPPPEEEPKSATPEDLGVKMIAEVGFKTPEAVLYDPEGDIYYVSNINGLPLDKDNNGFISKVTPTGEVTLEFIAAGKDGAELNAPKGLAISGGVLFVADIDVVRRFDLKTGKPGEVTQLPGSTFVNGLSVAGDGSVYVTDSGLTTAFTASGSDAVYKLTGSKVTRLTKKGDLGGPNGVAAADGGAWVVSFRGKELSFLTDAGKRERAQELPTGSLDGIQILSDGRLLVSSWESSSVYLGTPGTDFVEVISGVEAPAAIGFDAKRNRVLIPLFKKDSVVFHSLESGGLDAPAQ